jgi:NADH-quinone oxidoreductase subunit G
VQSFYAATKPLGDARPAWKVLRVLGNLLQVAGFEYNSSEDVRAEALRGQPEFVSGLDNGINGVALNLTTSAGGLERVADVPIHIADPLVRRAPALQQAADSAAPSARMNAATLNKLGVAAGDKLKVKVGAGGTATVTLAAELDAGLPDGTVRVAAAHADTLALGAMSAVLSVEKA